MATNAKRENPEHLENSELEVLRTKIRKLEQENFELKATVSANPEELQIISNDQVGHHETQETDVIDFLSTFMGNPGFNRIADNLLSALDFKSFNRCRQVCRSWKNYIDNEWTMLQLQIFHLKRYQEPGLTYYNGEPCLRLFDPGHDINFEPLFKIMEQSRNKSELRAFIKMCQELASMYRCDKLRSNPLRYMIDHHRHQELKLLLHCPIQKRPGYENFDFTRDLFTGVFKYACQYGCQICVKILLDRSEEKEIDFNRKRQWDEHCLFFANQNSKGPIAQGFKKGVVDLLLRSAEEKGIDIQATSSESGETLREKIINSKYDIDVDDYTEETYKILKIDPSVDLKIEILESESESGSETD